MVERTEAATQHPIDVERAMKVIDLVLQDAGVPALRLNAYLCAFFVQAVNHNVARTRNDGAESRQAETTFEEVDLRLR